MDTSKKSQNRRSYPIPCECGCGQLISKYGRDGHNRRFVSGHQNYGNSNGTRVYDLASILQQAESIKPFCQCGCGEKLEIPLFLQQKGRGIKSIESYWQRHPYKQGHGLWEKRTKKLLFHRESLSSNSLGLIYGTLLGDGTIDYPNQNSRWPRIRWNHGSKQQEWLEYKASRLPELQIQSQIVANNGYGELSIYARSVCHPSLGEVFQMVRPQGERKFVSLNWLENITPEGLAWWYMDDGSLSITPHGSRFIQLHTEGYSPAENQLIADWLTQRGYATKSLSYTRHSTGKIYHYLKMGASATARWIADLQPYAIPSMAYKFRGSDRDSRR
jgi:hypothetical protein